MHSRYCWPCTTAESQEDVVPDDLRQFLSGSLRYLRHSGPRRPRRSRGSGDSIGISDRIRGLSFVCPPGSEPRELVSRWATVAWLGVPKWLFCVLGGDASNEHALFARSLGTTRTPVPIRYTPLPPGFRPCQPPSPETACSVPTRTSHKSSRLRPPPPHSGAQYLQHPRDR